MFFCRYCKFDLDGGDIFDFFLNKGYSEKDALASANSYGWKQDNKKRFSKEIIVQFSETNKPQIKICPNCKGVWPKSLNMPDKYLEDIYK